VWAWIIVGTAAVAIGAWAVWPRRGGVSDGRVISSRRSAHGSIESRHNTNRSNWPTGG
jgi:hypothetical protein